MKLKNVFKPIVFIIVFVIIFNVVSRIFTISSDDHEYQFIGGIYEEEKDSLDAVYIGSSNTYAFWNPLVAWEEYGIAVHTYTCSSQPFIIAKYLIKEARKTQPNAVYLFNINTIGEEGLGGATNDDIIMHRVLDSMPFSVNKLNLTNYMADVAGFSFSERLEFYFPIIKYHSRWDELDKTYFNSKINAYKGSDYFEYYFDKVRNVSKHYKNTQEKAELTETLSKSLNDLLDYCDKHEVKAVFVTSPRAEENINTVAKINTVNEIIESRGYPTVNLIEDYKNFNLDYTSDFYNQNHTNIHGSIKYTYYLSEYLIENYGFEDKRNNSKYEDWNTGFEEYSKLLNPYILDFELDSVHRDFSLDRTETSVSKKIGGVAVTYNKVDGADGYAVYRKSNESKWEQIGKTDKLMFVDENYDNDKENYYTVVPYTVKDNEIYYGNYQYNGVKLS